MKYFEKKRSVRAADAKAPAPSVARIYGVAAANFILSENLFAQEAAIPQNEYKKQIFSLMHAAGNLAEQAEEFVEEEWPKLTVETDGLASGRALALAAKKDYLAQVLELAGDYSFATEPVWCNTQNIVEGGTYSVAVEKGGHVEKAILYANSTDTALDIVNKLAGALNAFAKTARAFAVRENGYARLEVVAASGGAAGAFDLYDDRGGILSRLAMRPAAKGKDLRVVVDGREYVRPHNHLVLDDGKLELDFARTGQARISVKPDNGYSMRALGNLVESYNAFEKAFFAINSRTVRADEMFKVFSRLFADGLAEGAGRLGVRQNGYELELDEAAGAESLRKSPELIANIGGKGGGLAFVLRNMARGVQRNPLSVYFAVPYGDVSKYYGLLVNLFA
jgi:hypothetical protein